MRRPEKSPRLSTRPVADPFILRGLEIFIFRVMRYARPSKLREYREFWTKVGAKTYVKFMSALPLRLPKVRRCLYFVHVKYEELSFQQKSNYKVHKII